VIIALLLGLPVVLRRTWAHYRARRAASEAPRAS
jgi:hypothetical protein